VTEPRPVVSEPPVAGGLDVDLPGPGVRLRATRWPGSGTPVLLLHGLASTRHIWDLVVPGLAGLPCWPWTSAGTATATAPRTPTTAGPSCRRPDRPGRGGAVPGGRRRALLGSMDGAAAGRDRARAGAGRGLRRRRDPADARARRHARAGPRAADAATDGAAGGPAAGGAAQRAAAPVVEPGRRTGGAVDLRGRRRRAGPGAAAVREPHEDRRRPHRRRPRAAAAVRALPGLAGVLLPRRARADALARTAALLPRRGRCAGTARCTTCPLQWPALVAGWCVPRPRRSRRG
jgi:hypothetical protein